MRVLGLLFSVGAYAGLTACSQTESSLPANPIVSLTLCADSYLHAFPDLEPRLAALSWQSRSALSVTPDHLKALPQSDTNPESAITWKNATRISSGNGRGDIDLKWGEDYSVVWENLERLSTSFNVEDPSVSLKTKLQNLQRPQKPPRILYLDRSGATAGPGTFVDAVIQSVGAENVVQTQGWHSPDTETLIQLEADIILTSFMSSDYSGVNDRTYRHAALAEKINSTPQIDIPGKFWPCAGPGLVDAATYLAQAISEI